MGIGGLYFCAEKVLRIDSCWRQTREGPIQSNINFVKTKVAPVFLTPKVTHQICTLHILRIGYLNRLV
jgi:hypothetical protein